MYSVVLYVNLVTCSFSNECERNGNVWIGNLRFSIIACVVYNTRIYSLLHGGGGSGADKEWNVFQVHIT